MKRPHAIVAAAALAFLLAAPAAGADVGLFPASRTVEAGGQLRGIGSGSGLAAYLVPARLGPRRYRCEGGTAICEPRVARPPGPPFVLLGRLRRTRVFYAAQPFRFRLPARLGPGAYRLYLYCPPCGGTLIQTGPRVEGEIVRVVPPRPTGPSVRFAAGRGSVTLRLRRGSGVILRFRLIVPHGTRAVASGRIPRLAGVELSTADRSHCRRAGPADVCDQAEEWCPMPATTWIFRIRKLAGPAGRITLDFKLGPPVY